MPTREEVDLARAAIDRGFLTVKESIKCLEIQQEHERGGRQVSLERIFVEAGFLNQAQLATLRKGLAKSAALRYIGHYEILSRLGAGGMGTVYKARDTKADRIIALKVLSPAHASNKEYIQRFLREAHASGRLSHPNIIQGYDAGEAGGQFYFVMEFIDGTTVGDMLKEGRPIPEQQALDIAIQIARALEHAEENHLVHRDIKPDNIMLTKDGTAKLADLGLARLTTGDPAGQERRAFGTAYYASPEQCQGVQELDTKSDMYSFGATIFHMLAGRVPFDAESPQGIMAMHLHEKRPYLKDINVQLSHGISKIVRKLMARNKRDRYQVMSDIVKDLTLIRMGRSPRLEERSRHDTSEYRFRSATGSWRTKGPSRRDKTLQIVLCIAVGIIICVGGYAAIQHFQTRPPKPAPPGPPPGPPAHQALFDQLLASGPKMPREEYLKKLKSFADTYPGTESAKKALAERERLMEQATAALEAKFREHQASIQKLRGEHKYNDAMKQLEEIRSKYGAERFAERLDRLRQEIESSAQTAFRETKGKADELAAAKNYDDAIALYTEAAKTLGIQTLIEQAGTEIDKLRKAKTDEDQRIADEEKRKAAEAEALKIRAEKTAIRETLKEIGALVQEAKFAEAAKKLRDTSDKVGLGEVKPILQRAASDLGELWKLIGTLKGASDLLKGKNVTIISKDTGKFEGAIFSIGTSNVSLECLGPEGKTIRGVPWASLDPSSIKMLAELNGGGKLEPAQRYALAALFCFAGRASEAMAELQKLAAVEAEKKAVELRRKDFEFFSKGGPNAGDK